MNAHEDFFSPETQYVMHNTLLSKLSISGRMNQIIFAEVSVPKSRKSCGKEEKEEGETAKGKRYSFQANATTTGGKIQAENKKAR